MCVCVLVRVCLLYLTLVRLFASARPELRLHDTARQADAITGRADKVGGRGRLQTQPPIVLPSPPVWMMCRAAHSGQPSQEQLCVLCPNWSCLGPREEGEGVGHCYSCQKKVKDFLFVSLRFLLEVLLHAS